MSSASNIERREQVQAALKAFADTPLAQAATQLLAALGYASEKTADLGASADALLGNIEQFKPELGTINRGKVKADRWKSCAFLFQLTNDEIPSLAIGQQAFSTDNKLARSLIESFVFMVIELQGESWSRTDLATIARELNRRFPMPAIVIFKHGELLSLVVIDRRANLKDATRDVIDNRITVIKDVRLTNPHRAHLDILSSLALENLGDKRRPSSFRELYDAWIAALSIQALNKRFYTELAWWYFWAVKQVTFPLGGGEDENRRNSVAVIRLLTRLIFSWFIKEKGLIPEALFDPNQLKTLLKSNPAANGEDSVYYHAILQNLFFASLNVEMGADRKWAADGGGMKGDRLIHSLYRHKEMFRDPDHVLSEYFSKIPFLNGGLFECLDRELTERDFRRNPELKALAAKEGNGYVLRVDGFSRRKDAQPSVPNKIFFGGEAQADLNADLGTKGKRFEVLGLIDIFGRYKFTVEENTPVEEEVALDPELLGKVFENLLASYNEDTQATARKQSGSFYTPREVVDYMVDEALIAYFERHLSSPLPQAGEGLGERAVEAPVGRVSPSGRNPTSKVSAHDDVGLRDEAANPTYAIRNDNEIDTKLRRLLSYADTPHEFSLAEVKEIIAAIESLKILDPACGSGAFPMGVLQKLVHVLKKLDPSNELWKTHNRAPLAAQLAEAKKIPDPSLRETKVEEAESALAKFDRDFANAKHADYTRKLYLIEKCIFGVDIQPIAVQIAKLRFFIALVVSQEVDKAKENWGITALPNLETKIVAADSLTPIREVKSGMMETFQLGYDIVKGIEADLHDASERYFSARTSKTKRKYREIIQDLRDKLASELEQSGFSTAKAQQLVHWNPFDQNAAADFFDPEWMFQIDTGFDIAIGNPPYRQVKKGIYSEAFFPFSEGKDPGKQNLYKLFVELSYKLVNKGGIGCLIVQSSLLGDASSTHTRKMLLSHAKLIKVLEFPKAAEKREAQVFEGVLQGTCIALFQRDKPSSDHQILISVGNDTATVLAPDFASIGTQQIFTAYPESYNIPLVRKLDAQVLRKIQGQSILLRDLIHQRESSKGDFNLGTERLRFSNRKTPVKLIRGRNVHRYWVDYDVNEFVEETFKPDTQRINCQRRFLITQNITGTTDDWRLHVAPSALGEKCLFGDTVNKILLKDEEATYFVLGVLNSKVIDWNFRKTSTNNHVNGYEIDELPIPKSNQDQRKIIEAIVNAIIVTNDPRFEQLINGLAFELFFPDDLHRANIRLFDACEKAGVGKLTALTPSPSPASGRGEPVQSPSPASGRGVGVRDAANELAERIFATSHPIYGMLFDLQALDVVRIVEGRE